MTTEIILNLQSHGEVSPKSIYMGGIFRVVEWTSISKIPDPTDNRCIETSNRRINKVYMEWITTGCITCAKIGNRTGQHSYCKRCGCLANMRNPVSSG